MNMHARNAATRGTNYTLLETGSLSDWSNNTVEIPGLGKIPGKLFLKDLVGLTGCEMSINAMPAGHGMPIHHTHRDNEEVYVFLHGKGQIQVDGQTLPVREGTVVRIRPNGERTWRNNGTETLVYIVIQMRQDSLRQWGTGDADVPDKPVVWPA